MADKAYVRCKKEGVNCRLLFWFGSEKAACERAGTGMGKQPGCEPARGTRDFGAVGEIGGVHGSIVSRTTEIMRKDRNQRVGLRQNPSYTAKKNLRPGWPNRSDHR